MHLAEPSSPRLGRCARQKSLRPSRQKPKGVSLLKSSQSLLLTISIKIDYLLHSTDKNGRQSDRLTCLPVSLSAILQVQPSQPSLPSEAESGGSFRPRTPSAVPSQS